MRKLIISLVIILMFAFSLNKLNPIKEGKPTKEIGHSKKRIALLV